MRYLRRAAAYAAGMAMAAVLPLGVTADGPVPAPSAAPTAPGEQRAAPPEGTRQLRYDPATERVVKGKVEALTDLPITNGAVREVTVRIDASTPAVVVRLGALRHLAKHQLEVVKGDAVEVTGSLVRDGSRDVVLARLVTVGGRTVVLRLPRGRMNHDPAEGVPGRSR